jgi:hypothetical protein
LPPEELLDDELRDDEDERDEDELDELDGLDELDDDELEGALLLLELGVEEPLDSGSEDVLDPPDEPSGPVGDVPHPTPNMPTPARATPPESILRNCRRSSRRAASSTGCGFSHCDITTSLAGPLSNGHATGGRQSGGSAPPS